MSVRVYELFPVAGGFSNQTADYDGTTVAVAAGSSKQAHALAHKDVWASDPDDPLGILWVYRRGESPDHRLFSRDRVYGNQVRHGAGKRAIVAWMRGVLEPGGG
jgi:hypothetical protein